MAKQAPRRKLSRIRGSGVSEVEQQEGINGIVISHLGKSLAIESASRETFICHTRRRLERPAVGDRVKWEQIGGNSGRVLAILPRKTVLLRPASNGKDRPLAANIDQILIVVAIQPESDLLLVDQILVVCEQRGIKAHLLVNKIDLADDEKMKQLIDKLIVYERIGYSVYRLSAKSTFGVDRLQPILKDRTSMLVGQSGVGKSSISKILLPDKELRIATLSAASGKGRHTTTTSTLYHLPDGGDLIDSPGMAIFGLSQISQMDLAYGYREFRDFISKCRFNDCRHHHDKGCAVRPEVERDVIDRRRYRRYLKLMENLLIDKNGGI